MISTLLFEQLHRSLASSKADYERVHSRLMYDMPRLYENRVGYFDQCLQAVIKAQVRLENGTILNLKTMIISYYYYYDLLGSVLPRLER